MTKVDFNYKAPLTAPRGTETIVVAFTLTALSTIVVSLRFYSRHFLVGKLSSPDWMMFFALVTTWGTTVINKLQIHFKDFRWVHDEKSAFAMIRGGLLTFWIYRIFYLVTLCLIKLSILLFYRYIFSAQKVFLRIVNGLITVVLVTHFAMIIASILTCNPPSAAWSVRVFLGGSVASHKAHCYNPVILWFFNASFNLVTDFIIWILPMTFLLKLQSMHYKRKLELISIFSIGIVAIIASAIRMWILVRWTSSWAESDQLTGDFLIWGQVEQHAGIISASIPFIRPVFRKIFHKSEKREQPSPSPARNLLPSKSNTQQTPDLASIDPPRTPIIPAPSPTLSPYSPYKPPPSNLSPILPIRPEVSAGSTF